MIHGCLITLAGTLLFVAQPLSATTLTIRSGNGSIGGNDSLVHVLTGPTTGAFGHVFGPSDFAAAQSSPEAFIVVPNALWIAGLSADPSAKWVSSVNNSLFGNTALYAVSFQISSAFTAATLAVNYAVDDGIGDGYGDSYGNSGIYLNGSAVCGGSLPIGFSQEHPVNCGDVTQFLHTGTNWLYIEDGNAAGAAGLLFSATVATTAATGPIITVPGTAMPWLYGKTAGSLNYNSQFGLGDGTNPIVVSAANGVAFTPGGIATVTYMSGKVNIGPDLQLAFVDANGISQAANNTNQGAIGKAAPSNYMSPSTYPIFYGELVGTFADATGSIIGTPFAIGDGPKPLIIPSGASQLQLGVNDDAYYNNVGSWSVQVTTALQPPVLSNNGVVNSTTLAPGGPVAPGSISSLLGTFPVGTPSLSPATGSNWPTSLGGLSVQVGGTPAPLFYVSSSLVHFQVPWELAGLMQAAVTVTSGGQTSTPQTANLATYAPGLYAINGQGTGQGAVLDASYQLVTASNPTKPGAYIQLYGTGLGPVSNQPATGTPDPLSPFATTPAHPGVTIGGITAPVLFSGLLPTGIGYYQINVQVPDGVSSGNSVPVILSIGGITSNTVTIAVQSPVPSNPVPTITSLSPSSALSGSGPLTVTISGTGFVATSTVTFCTVPHTATFVDGSHLQITLSVTDLAGTGACAVVVSNPAPGGGSSFPMAFTVAPINPKPAIISLTPSSAPEGSSSSLTVTISGSGFLPSSTVTFCTLTHSVTFVDSSHLQITLTAFDVGGTGACAVVVSNPAPGGGVSAAAIFTVTAPVGLGGTWLGSWNSSEYLFVFGSLSANLTQSGSVLTGTLTFAGSPCFSSGTLSGSVNGSNISATINFGAGQTAAINGAANSSNTAINAKYTLYGGACTDSGTISLSR